MPLSVLPHVMSKMVRQGGLSHSVHLCYLTLSKFRINILSKVFVVTAEVVRMNESAAVEGATPDESGGSEGKRQRSTIAFPYTDYDNAEKIAQAIHGNVGHGVCALDQLAPWTGQSAKSSTFRAQVAAARLFGLVESDGAEAYQLTQLGARVVDQAQARAAKAEAFLTVPLFKAVYERYKGAVLPEKSTAIEHEIAVLGVSEKQKARARQVLLSSAEQTGFFGHGKNKLVMPAVVVPAAVPEVKKKNGYGGDEGVERNLDLDPLLMALLRKIPSREEGWPSEKRVRWFRTFAMNVSQVYDSDDQPVELMITCATTN